MQCAELERRYPGLARESVTFQVRDGGSRGLLGVCSIPRLVSSACSTCAAPPLPALVENLRRSAGRSRAALVHELLERIAAALATADQRRGAGARRSQPASACRRRCPDQQARQTINTMQYVVGAASARPRAGATHDGSSCGYQQ